VKIAIVGTGYVGLVTGACLADVGVEVCCVDVDAEKIRRIELGDLPIFEPGLDVIVKRNASKGRLRFTTDLASALRGAQAVFISVGTPESEDGSADLRHVEAVATDIGRSIEDHIVVVTKSTVPVGTAERVRVCVSTALSERGSEISFDVASNPEFLKEGAAIADFMRPDRIVVGVDSDRAAEVLTKIYRPFVLNGHPLIVMDIPSAEITKYAANAMLAVRISFMNTIASICEQFGADVTSVRQGIGSDPRIGRQFLYSGVGYGGSCFPKDVRALMKTGEDIGVNVDLLRAADEINDRQKELPVERLVRMLGEDLAGRTIALWGLAFKPNTDDMREAPALVIAHELIRRGAAVRGYDPVSSEKARPMLPAAVEIVDSAEAAIADADALVLVTEWPEFRSVNAAEVRKTMRGDIVIDGRNVLDRADFEEHGFRYSGIGLGRSK
jgi:UDPglucose 6-dehydrogenase